MFFFFKQNTPSTNHQKKRSKVAIFQINSFQQFSKRSVFSFPVYQQPCAKASPNNRDKFGRFSNHSGYDLTLVSESLTFCKSANKTPPTGRFRVIPFSTKRSTFHCIILASRSHPSLQHEGRTSIPAITGYTAGAGYARQCKHWLSLVGLRPTSYQGFALYPCALRGFLSSPLGQRFREIFGTSFRPRGLHPLAAL